MLNELTFEVTNKCNNLCLHCSSKSDSYQTKELDIDFIINKIKEYEPLNVYISGGEPFLYSDLVGLLETIKTNFKHINLKVYSSGYANNAYKILKDIKDYVNGIVFPYYSNLSIVHNYITNTGSFFITKSAIEYSLKLGINTEIHIVPMSINISSLDDTIEELINMGINNIKLLKLVEQGRCADNPILTVPDSILNKEIEKIKKKYGSVIKLGAPFTGGTCKSLMGDKLVIQYNGNIISCESYKDGENKCSRFKKNNS